MFGARDLDWQGCVNVRELGGLRTAGGEVTRPGAVVRADHPRNLTAVGWSQLWEHGIRTVISLRTATTRTSWRPGPAPTCGGTPLYFADALARWPQRHAAAVAAVARARPGGVLIHCGRGCDRTGILTLLLLACVGVAPHDIAADYARSAHRLEPREPGYQQRVTELLAAKGTTASEVIYDLLRSLDVEAYLRRGGLDDGDLAALRRRLTTATAR